MSLCEQQKLRVEKLSWSRWLPIDDGIDNTFFS